MRLHSKIFKRHKFNAKPVREDDRFFASKLENKYYNHLKFLQKTGDVLFFTRQVPFELDFKNTRVTRYVADFQVFWTDGNISFVDVKGRETDVFLMKKKMVETQYPVEITIVKRGDF